MTTDGDCFMLSVTGQIVKAKFPGYNYIWCKYCFSTGPDWMYIAGIPEGMTQTSLRGQDVNQDHVFNFPIDISWKSSNPFGWPQIIVHAYGVDVFGKDVIRGYGAVHIPMESGKHSRRIAMFVPQSSSKLMQLNAWFTGRRPEFVSPKVIASGDGREVTKVQTQGFVDLAFNVATKNLRNLGYVVGRNRSDLTNEDLLLTVGGDII
ncbi:B9 protein domain 1 [Latimeria chalumnae] [Paragonimus heterotremus]|uniref:B9 domain-containing protein 1 n=1 Tax=Paragonimus heterotremus TaxID=100268 RepID=A0A8J4TA01_9TREM|nr:B9 protein domain 1 [Latimeria chalumnae] [Paragonimus heterotremus]